MPDSEANEPSKADLERRVDQLEATVQKMMPTRRGVLTGLAGAGIGGAAVYGASENARAQAAGAQGTEAEPNDMWAWNLNVANQVTSDLAMGGNDVTDVGAMDVDNVRIDNENISDDATDPELWGSWTSGPGKAGVRHQEIARQVTADGTGHDLFDTRFRAGFVVVAGNEDGDVTQAFVDIVLLMAGVAGTIVESLNRGTPPTRSYDLVGGDTADISIDGSSETYNVSATGTALLES